MAGFTPAVGIGQNQNGSRAEFNRGYSNLMRLRGDLVEQVIQKTAHYIWISCKRASILGSGQVH